MRGLATVRWLPKGRYLLTLKARAVTESEYDYERLRAFLYNFASAVQRIVDIIWDLDKVPTQTQMHQLFYERLRRCGFRAHVAKQIYRYALALVKSAKANGGSKPQIRKLFARLDKYDVSLNLEKMVLVLKTGINGDIKLRLLHSRKYTRKFLGREWYEVQITIDKSGNIWVCVPFRFDYSPHVSKSIVAVDINLKQVIIYDGREVRHVKTRFIEALYLKKLAEEVQKRHNKSWRYSEKWLALIRSLHRRSRNIIVDWCRKFAKWLIEYVKKRKAFLVLEDLEGLWHTRSQEDSKLAWLLSRFAYRKLITAILTKAIEHNVPVMFVDPRNTSRTCPRCGSYIEFVHRLGYCKKCGFVADRDKIAVLNLTYRAIQTLAPCQGHGAPTR